MVLELRQCTAHGTIKLWFVLHSAQWWGYFQPFPINSVFDFQPPLPQCIAVQCPGFCHVAFCIKSVTYFITASSVYKLTITLLCVIIGVESLVVSFCDTLSLRLLGELWGKVLVILGSFHKKANTPVGHQPPPNGQLQIKQQISQHTQKTKCGKIVIWV